VVEVEAGEAVELFSQRLLALAITRTILVAVVAALVFMDLVIAALGG
jgi:hypothetical protein